jgi:hypothetical protein
MLISARTATGYATRWPMQASVFAHLDRWLRVPTT